ncbi:MAG: hypothetical protein ACXV5B_07810 [Halobacteriota archaeon]
MRAFLIPEHLTALFVVPLFDYVVEDNHADRSTQYGGNGHLRGSCAQDFNHLIERPRNEQC